MFIGSVDLCFQYIEINRSINVSVLMSDKHNRTGLALVPLTPEMLLHSDPVEMKAVRTETNTFLFFNMSFFNSAISIQERNNVRRA